LYAAMAPFLARQLLSGETGRDNNPQLKPKEDRHD
jgi:hypothetical protein